ncbi:MAG: glycosyltransferase family 4 protein [Chitinophagaceae bacterium]|nr:glycosyltransferase family 4 protein [Chitinophagaceae bacterium]
MKPEAIKILFLVLYPVNHAPSQRFRVELFLPYLRSEGYEYRINSFYDEKTWRSLYNGGNIIQKFWGVCKGYFKRWMTVLFTLRKYDFIFIPRGAAPLGPPLFEWIITKIFQKKLIYDFDDAIWIPNTGKENKLVAWFKASWKVKYICKWSYKVVGGNDYLCTYAKKFNQQVVKIPTCVDTENQHNRIKNQQTEKIVIGWTGSHSTLIFTKQIIPALNDVYSSHPFEFIVIANKPPEYSLPYLKYIPWDSATEVEDLLKMNIGVMPLENDPWCEGKCGFKIIQYLSLGIPAVASPIGVNAKIIDERENGFLCKTKEEWIQALTKLIEDETVRTQMGKNGREKIQKYYSVKSQITTFLQLFHLNV